jgi:hypothetical protein
MRSGARSIWAEVQWSFGTRPSVLGGALSCAPTDLAEISDLMNGRPRQTLGWMTREKLDQLGALAA